MPQLNKSEAVRKRSHLLLQKLIAFANYELPDCEHLENKISVRWLDLETNRPKLIVKTEIRFLAALVSPTVTTKTKEHIKQDLRSLKDFLGILEDNRDRTQGTGIWHFTLKLWHRDTERNLTAFDTLWQQRKQVFQAATAQKTAQKIAERKKAKAQKADPPETESQSKRTAQTAPYHNLPTRDYGTFIGREQSLNQLTTLLTADQAVSRISLLGPGGIGKTALALEAAHRALAQPPQSNNPFQALIFTTARTQHLTPQGILPSYRYSRSLQDIFRAIAQTLKQPGLLTQNFDRQLESIYTLLSQQRTLLILDNLESLPDSERNTLLSFLYDLPSSTKALITSRTQLTLDAIIQLQPLTQPEALEFISHQATLKSLRLTKVDTQTLYQQTGGIPAAIAYALGQTTAGYPIPKVLPQLTLQNSDYCRYYLQSTLDAIADHPTYQTLLTIAILPGTTTATALPTVSQTSADQIANNLSQLQKLSLISKTNSQEQFSLLPLTRDYLLSQLENSTVNSIKEKWLVWYQSQLVAYHHLNWREWHDYTALDGEWENLQALIDWCIATEKVDAFSQLWQGLRGYTHLRGYWNERLGWLNWWLEQAKEKGDTITQTQALRDLGWSLTLMGQPQQLAQANHYFEQAWQQSKTADLQLEIAIEHVILHLIQNQLTNAQQWLETSKSLLRAANLDPTTKNAQETRILYYTAQLYYHQQQYEQAKSLYQMLLAATQSKTDSKSQQTSVYILNWLVDIALNQSNLDEAERLLEQSWPIITTKGDMRSQAFHQRSKAQLEKQRGNLSAYQHWSQQAKHTFEKLGMSSQAREIET